MALGGLARPSNLIKTLFGGEVKPPTTRYLIAKDGRSRQRYLTEEQVTKLTFQGYSLTESDKLPGQPVLVDDHEQRLEKSYGHGRFGELDAQWNHGKKWSGKLKKTPASLHSTVKVRQLLPSGVVHTYLIPRSQFNQEEV